MKTAVIFGGESQAGYYLNNLLLGKGYKVIACSHKDCDVSRSLDEISKLLRYYRPDEVYNFASLMFAPDSWKDPVKYMEVNCLGVLNILHELHGRHAKCRFFQAGSAEIFDRNYFPQNEKTPIKPSNPYGVAKSAAQELVRVYRQQGMYACTGILFNMESPRRKDSFFVRKVIKGVIDIKKGYKSELLLGNLFAIRDWGLTSEYVEAMWLMLQQIIPDDYVIGTGKAYSCLHFVEEVCTVVGVDFNKHVQYQLVKTDADAMCANPHRIKELLGWEAKTTGLTNLVTYLVEAELNVQSAAVR